MWLWLHGFTGSPRAWDALRGSFDTRPVTPWLFGHGVDWRSRLGVQSFSDEVTRLAGIAADHPPPRSLLGYSLGARLGLGLLSEHPQLFDAAVLIGVHPGLRDDESRAARRTADADLVHLLRERGLDAFVRHWESQPIFDSQRTLPSETRAAQRAIRLAHDPEGLARSLEVLGLAEMPDFRASIGAFRGPVTLVTGSLDEKLTRLAGELASSHRGIGVEVVDGVGHNVVLEAPGAVAEVLGRAPRGRRA